MSAEEKDKEKPDIPPINEYYQLVLNEYNNERDRKNSIETRSGVVLVFIAAFYVFALENCKLVDIFNLFDISLTFILLCKIVTVLGFHIAFFISVFFSWYSIKTRIYPFYDMSTLQYPCPKLEQIIIDFVGKPQEQKKGIIQQHRDVNSKKAKCFDKAMIFLFICIICLCIYTNLKGGIDG